MRRSKTTKYEDIVRAYQAETKASEVELKLVIPWAMTRGLLADPPDPVRYHIEQASEALRRSKFKDRDVRKWHSVTVEADAHEGKLIQRVLWGHLDDATEAFLRTSLEQRITQLTRDRDAILRDIEGVGERFPDAARWLRQTVFKFNQRESA